MIRLNNEPIIEKKEYKIKCPRCGTRTTIKWSVEKCKRCGEKLEKEKQTNIENWNEETDK